MKKIIKALKEAVFAGLEDVPFAGKALRRFADVYKNEPVEHNIDNNDIAAPQVQSQSQSQSQTQLNAPVTNNLDAVIAKVKKSQLEKDELKRRDDARSVQMQIDYAAIVTLIQECPDALAEHKLALEHLLSIYPLEQLHKEIDKQLHNTISLVLKNGIVLKSGDVIHGHYIIHPNGTVTDTRTKLMWKRCCEGQTWDGTTCIGEAKKTTWIEIMPDEKQKYWSAFAGHNDWRVPTVDELKSLVYCSSGIPKTWNDTDNKCEGYYQPPTIDQVVFPNTPAEWCWTATAYAAHSSFSWIVSFRDGYVGSYSFRFLSLFVRCVRLGQ